MHAHENLRQRNVLLRVEIGRQLLVGQKLVADQNPLSGINAAKTAAQERAAANRDGLAGVILEQDQIVITKGEKPIASAQAFQGHVRRAVGPERKRFERRRAALVDGSVGILRGVQLINDVDRLRRHAELRHERVKSDDLFLLQARLRNQIVELHSEHDLAIGAELGRQFLRHRGQVLLLVKRLPEELAQLRVDRFRVIVAKEPKARIDFFLEQNAVRLRKARQHLDEKRQQIRPLGNAARFAQSATHPAPASPLDPVGKRSHALHCAVDLVCD